MQEFNFDFDELLKDDIKEENVEEVETLETEPESEEVKVEEPNPLMPERPKPEDLLKEEKPPVVEEKKPEPKKVVKKAEPKAEVKADAQTSNVPASKPSDFNVALVEKTIGKITELAKLSNQIISEREKNLATDIVLTTNKTILVAGYNWKQIDVLNNNFFGNIKRWAKLGVDASTDHLYIDLRKNSKTGAVDINIKPQYQTIRKLIVKYCTKKIVNFRDDVVCKSDNLVRKFDFLTGSEKIVEHNYGESRNPNSLDDILGAYVVAFYENKDGSIGQIVSYIDKDRIMRAYNSAQTKNVWNNDTKKMVIKTAYWEMWNGASIQPFMAFPDDIINDLAVVNESSDVDFSNKDHKYANVDSAEDNFKEKVGSGEIIDF